MLGRVLRYFDRITWCFLLFYFPYTLSIFLSFVSLTETYPNLLGKKGYVVVVVVVVSLTETYI